MAVARRPPAARASSAAHLSPSALAKTTPTLGHVRSVKAPSGAGPTVDGDRRGDGDLGQIDAIEQRRRGRPRRRPRGAASSAEPICLAARSSSSAPVIDAAHIADRRPNARPARRRARSSGTIGEGFEMDAGPLSSGWRASQASSAVKHRIGASQRVRQVEDDVHHRARGAAARIGRLVAIERVLADVEIEGREIDGAEIVQFGEHRHGTGNRRRR